MAISGSFKSTGYKVGTTSKWERYLVFSWTRTDYSIATNSSTISYTLKGAGGSSDGSWVTATAVSLIVDGETVYTMSKNVNVTNGMVLASGTVTLKHNDAGKRNFTASVSGGLYYRGNVSGDGSWSLDTIPRQATITSAPSFDDEANPTIKYSNPAGTAVSTLQACISLDGSAADVAYRDIPKNGTSYTFELTNAERNILRNATTTANSRTVKFYVKTVIGGVTYYSSVSKSFSIVNADPVLSDISVSDGNSVTLELTGNADTLIKYHSNASVNYSYAAQKGASIKSSKVSCGNQSRATIPTTFSAVENNKFVFNVTDSRGNVTSKTVTKTMIPYVKLTCNLEDSKPDADGDMTISVSGNYFNGSFGAVKNTLTVQYRYKESGTSVWSDWTNLSVSLSDNTYTASGSLSGLNYQTLYVFQARAIDKLATVPTKEREVKSIPVFDWGESDFNFNVPVSMNNQTVLRHNETANNTVLSASGGFIYFRPGGTEARDAEVLITPQGNIQLTGDIIINGQSLKSLLGIE